jgi:ubiquinone/menaquinone biosynthesis C-methylase UbiE
MTARPPGKVRLAHHTYQAVLPAVQACRTWLVRASERMHAPRRPTQRIVFAGRLAPVVLLASACLFTACDAKRPESIGDAGAIEQAAGKTYEFAAASRDGIGKFYMGREISQVMGHLGAAWLERPTREREERTDLLIDNLPLKADSVVADIGAGTGYFSFGIAKRVPQGEVLAVDIQREMLDMIEARKADGPVKNVTTILGTPSDPHLPEAAVDLILIVDAYHEFSHPREMAEAMVRSLVPGGSLVLIEYRAEDPAVAIKPLHKMTAAQAIAEMRAVGLTWERTENFLPQQHFLVFRRPAGISESR